MIGKLLDIMNEDAERAAKYEQAIKRVRSLHFARAELYPFKTAILIDKEWIYTSKMVQVCDFCQYLIEANSEDGGICSYPCPTIKALDGDD